MNKRPLILCIETATQNCSVAIFKADKQLYLRENATDGYSHAENLHQFIHEGLLQLEASPRELSVVAVSSGPGSYTGLRIGVSAAKGLCFALNVPLIAVSTLETIARNIKTEKDNVIISSIDARGKEIYAAVYDGMYGELQTQHSQIINSDSFISFHNKKCYFVGTGLLKIEEVIKNPYAKFCECYPSSKNMISASLKKYIEKDFEDLAYFVPIYLKPYAVHKKLRRKI